MVSSQANREVELILTRAVARSRVPEKSQVESTEHQDNADIHHQAFPKSASEERQIYTDDNGCHR
jgi:hypothetical protein